MTAVRLAPETVSDGNAAQLGLQPPQIRVDWCSFVVSQFLPNAQLLQLGRRAAGPIPIGGGTRRAGVQDGGDFGRGSRKDAAGTGFGESADSQQPFRLQNAHHLSKMFIAGSKK